MCSIICISLLRCTAMCSVIFFFKQKTAYEWRISDWSSDVCSSDLAPATLRDWLDQPAGGLRLLCHPEAGPSLGEALAAQPGLRQLSLLVGPEELGRASCRERVCQYV